MATQLSSDTISSYANRMYVSLNQVMVITDSVTDWSWPLRNSWTQTYCLFQRDTVILSQVSNPLQPIEDETSKVESANVKSPVRTDLVKSQNLSIQFCTRYRAVPAAAYSWPRTNRSSRASQNPWYILRSQTPYPKFFWSNWRSKWDKEAQGIKKEMLLPSWVVKRVSSMVRILQIR